MYYRVSGWSTVSWAEMDEELIVIICTHTALLDTVQTILETDDVDEVRVLRSDEEEYQEWRKQ